jgi:hypothetical protein
MFIPRQSWRIVINGSLANARPEIFAFLGLFGPQNLTVTVTYTKSVQFTTLYYSCRPRDIIPMEPRAWVTGPLADGLQQQGGPELVPPVYLRYTGHNVQARLLPARRDQTTRITEDGMPSSPILL